MSANNLKRVDPEEGINKLLNLSRSFLRNKFNLEKGLTLTEIATNVNQKKIREFCEKLQEKKYSGKRVKKEDVKSLVETFKDIIENNKLTFQEMKNKEIKIEGITKEQENKAKREIEKSFSVALSEVLKTPFIKFKNKLNNKIQKTKRRIKEKNAQEERELINKELKKFRNTDLEPFEKELKKQKKEENKEINKRKIKEKNKQEIEKLKKSLRNDKPRIKLNKKEKKKKSFFKFLRKKSPSKINKKIKKELNKKQKNKKETDSIQKIPFPIVKDLKKDNQKQPEEINNLKISKKETPKNLPEIKFQGILPRLENLGNKNHQKNKNNEESLEEKINKKGLYSTPEFLRKKPKPKLRKEKQRNKYPSEIKKKEKITKEKDSEEEIIKKRLEKLNTGITKNNIQTIPSQKDESPKLPRVHQKTPNIYKRYKNKNIQLTKPKTKRENNKLRETIVSLEKYKEEIREIREKIYADNKFKALINKTNIDTKQIRENPEQYQKLKRLHPQIKEIYQKTGNALGDLYTQANIENKKRINEILEKWRKEQKTKLFDIQNPFTREWIFLEILQTSLYNLKKSVLYNIY
jgi:hypothetical protein